MPIVTIELRKGYAPDREVQIIDAVHSAMMEGLKIPSWDKNVRLFVHEPHRFATPPGKDERYALCRSGDLVRYANVRLTLAAPVEATEDAIETELRLKAGGG